MSRRAIGGGVALPRQSEHDWQDTVLQYAGLMGWHHWHDVATNARRVCPHCRRPLRLPRNRAGLPDLILVRRPRVVWAELKADDGHLTPAQRAWLDELRACGQEAYVWRPRDWPEVERVLGRDG